MTDQGYVCWYTVPNFHLKWLIILSISDVYIEKVSKQKPVSKIQQDRQKLKISTAENVKQMYEHYCCRKWTKIESTMQQLISSATVSGIANIARPNLHITRGNNLQAMNIHEDADLSSGNVFNECDRGN